MGQTCRLPSSPPSTVGALAGRMPWAKPCLVTWVGHGGLPCSSSLVPVLPHPPTLPLRGEEWSHLGPR